MPKSKGCTKLIPRIYKKNAENLMLFTWVNCAKMIVPTITTEQAIWKFFKFIDVDDWDIETARTEYNSMLKEYYEDGRENT